MTSNCWIVRRAILMVVVSLGIRESAGAQVSSDRDGAVVKAILASQGGSENRLDSGRWQAFEQGFERAGKEFVCDNGSNANKQRGATQSVELRQTVPAPIVARAWSKAEGVTGSPDANYSLYLDLVYADGTQLWGQFATFDVGSHDWQRRQVVVVPEKPVQRVSMYLLLRSHAGKAWFRDPELRVMEAPQGACLLDGLPVAGPAARSHGD